tara:strand:+ start:5140 stop:5580 length:441 start_codon:yes stop_codon:yes gene_type:complete
MLDVYQIAEKISDINPAQLLQKLLGRRDIKKLMIDLNTDNQLRKRNENPFNVKLASIGGGYAPSYARKKGVAPNKVDLRDSGRYYKTFKVTPLANGNAEITSDNTIHGPDTFLANERWGEVEGLNEANTKIVLHALDEEIIQYILS